MLQLQHQEPREGLGVAAPTIQISDLLNANAGWARDDMGDIDALTQDIRKRGVLIPIVVAAPDYLVLDGARRIVAAQQAGLKQVPMTWCRDWPTAVEALKVSVQQPDAYPMTWAELLVVWDHIFKPLSNKYRYHIGNVVSRRNGTKKPRGIGYSDYGVQLAEIYSTTPGAIKTFRDGWSLLRNTQESEPEFYAKMTEAIATVMKDPANRDIPRGRQIKYAVHRIQMHGLRTTVEEVVQTFCDMVTGPQITGKRATTSYLSRGSYVHRSEPPVASATIHNWVMKLEQLAQQGDLFLNFKEDEAAANALAGRITVAVRQIHATRRRLENSIQQKAEEANE